MKVQAEDQVIYDLIQWYRTKELHRGQDTDSPEMKQFLWQRGKCEGTDIVGISMMYGWYMLIPRQLRFSLYSGAVITEGRCSLFTSLL